MSSVPAETQQLDRVSIVASEVLDCVRKGEEPRRAAASLFAERRGFLPVGSSPDELVSVAARLARKAHAG